MSEAEVSKEVSVIGIGEQIISHQDLPVPDCNGSSDHSQASDLDKSYVFVTGTDGLPDDDAVGDVDVAADENTAAVEDKSPQMVSEKEELDVVTGEGIKSLDEERIRIFQSGNGDPLIEIDSTRKHECSNDKEHGVRIEEHTFRSESLVEPEAKPVEDDPDVKDPNFERVSIEDLGDENGQIEGRAEQDKCDDDVTRSEYTPVTVENRVSQVEGFELASQSPENGDSGSANGGYEDQNTTDECDNAISSTEELQANEGSQVVAKNVIEGESEDMKSAEKFATEVVETTGDEFPPSASLELDMKLHTINDNEEMRNEEATITGILDIHEQHQLDTALENNSQSGSEQRAEPEPVSSPIDCHVEYVCDLVIEEKKEESFASHVGSGIHHVEELDKHSDSTGMPHETMHAESKADASLSTECSPTSSAHSPQTESQIPDAAAIETVPSLPLDGTVSENIENGFPDPDSQVRSMTNDTISGSDSTIDVVVLPEKEPDEVLTGKEQDDVLTGKEPDDEVLTGKEPDEEVLTEKEQTIQDDEMPAEAEVSRRLSEAADSQPAGMNLEPDVHVHNCSAVSNGEKADASVTCRMEVLDGFTFENGTAVNSLLEAEGVQNMSDHLHGAASGGHENVFLEGKEDPGKSGTFDVILEPGLYVHDTGSSDRKADAMCRTCREEVLDGFNVESECAANTALQVQDVLNIGDQLGDAAVGMHEDMRLQENQTTGKSEAFDVNLEPEVSVLKFSTTTNEEKSGDVAGVSTAEVLDSVDVVNEDPTNAEIEDVQYKGDQLDHAAGSSHEKVISQENEAAGNSETSDVKLEPGVHFHTVSAISSGGKTDVMSATCRTEVLDKFNVGTEAVADTELEVESFQNTGDDKLDAAAGDNLIVEENEDDRKSGSNNIAGAKPEGSISDTIFRKEPIVKAKIKPFNFLVRVPRFDEGNLREQIRLAKLHVDEKTKIRDAIQVQIQEKRASTQIHGVDYEFAKGESRNARKLVRSKRMEIDSLQTMINKAKNALSIDDIDSQIQSMERMIQHETLPLKEEKLLIREIKQLKQLREQLSSNLGSQDEIKHALEQREEVEERLKTLRKELDVLKGQVLKAEAAAVEAGKKYDDENKKVRELQVQFRAADDVRQLAYAELQSLRKELSKKNEHFFKYKDAAAIANNYAFSGNTEAFYCLCTENVKTFMELWNTDTEFRKEYAQCNTRSTIRRLGTLDGRSYGPNEQPLILPSLADDRKGRMISAGKTDTASQILPIPEPKQETSIEPKPVASNGKSMQKVTENKNENVAKETSVPVIENGHTRSADEVHEEQPNKSAQEIESIRRAEEMRKEEAEAELKEQRRLEALAKANEARERKKRRAEKLQMRTELKLQKEAEQKEKEREKRLRKKERKHTASSDANDNNHNSETAASSESAPEISRDAEVKNSMPKKGQKQRWTAASKSKTIPPALRSRNKRKLLQQWMWVGAACLLILFLFWMGNVSLFSSNLPKRRTPFH